MFAKIILYKCICNLRFNKPIWFSKIFETTSRLDKIFTFISSLVSNFKTKQLFFISIFRITCFRLEIALLAGINASGQCKESPKWTKVSSKEDSFVLMDMFEAFPKLQQIKPKIYRDMIYDLKIHVYSKTD